MEREACKKHIIAIAEKHKAASKSPNFDQEKFTKNLSQIEKITLEKLITDAALRIVINNVCEKLGG